MLKDRDDEDYKTIMLINPEILEFSEDTTLETE
jgi:peptide deformylase